MEITPRVTYEGEVILELTLENSSLGQNVDVAGQSIPSFNSRKVATHLRLREGESNLLAGLIGEDERKSIQGFPGLIHVPGFKQALSGNDIDDQEHRHRDADHAARRSHARIDVDGSRIDLHRHAAERWPRRAAAVDCTTGRDARRRGISASSSGSDAEPAVEHPARWCANARWRSTDQRPHAARHVAGARHRHAGCHVARARTAATAARRTSDNGGRRRTGDASHPIRRLRRPRASRP